MAPRHAKNTKKAPRKVKASKKAIRVVPPLRGDLLLSLPAELIFEVFKFVGKVDLKSLRLVCKALAGLITPLLFDSIFLSGNTTDLDHASLTNLNFGKFVKTIYISPLIFEGLPMSTYRGRVRERLGDIHQKRGIKWQEHVNKGFEVYRNLRESTDNTLSSGELSVLLSHALVTTPGIRRVVLTNANRKKDVSDAEAQKVCPDMAKCKLPRASHSHFYLPPRKLWRWSPSSTAILHSIFLAMSTTSTPVKEFAIEPLDEDLWLSAQSFKMMPRQVSPAAAVLSNLTKLNLTLTDSLPLTTDESVFQDMQIAKALSSACNLEVLLIQADFGNVFDVFGVTSFEAIFHGCQFRKLKTLYLFALDAQVQEVLHFLGHIEKLEHLAIDCCELKNGLWSDLAEWTRTYGHLKYASFDQLYGGFGEVDVIEWFDMYCGYEDFFFNSRPNPFSTHELVRYVKNRESKRVALKSSASGPLHYYQKWF